MSRVKVWMYEAQLLPATSCCIPKNFRKFCSRMSDKQAVSRLSRELAILEKNPVPQMLARPSDKSMLVWHYALFDLPANSAYCGGVYHGKLVFPAEYPLKPPAIYMITPSGRFLVGTKLCLSMSDFHPETWNPAWRVETILVGLVSFMLDPTDPSTAGGCFESRSTRQRLALSSFDFNRNDKIFSKLFPELTDTSKYQINRGFYLNTQPRSDDLVIIPDAPPSITPPQIAIAIFILVASLYFSKQRSE